MFVKYYLKFVIPPTSQSFSPFYILCKFLNPNMYRKTSYLNKRQIFTISNKNINGKKQCVLPSLLTFSFSIPFFGSESKEEGEDDETKVVTIMKKAILALFGVKYKEEEEEEDDETKVVIIMKRAVLAMRDGKPEIAEQLLHLALKSAQELDNQQAITYIYDLMANYAFENGEYKKAEILFLDILKRFLQNGMAMDHNAVVDVSLKLASIYSHLGDNERACQGFQFCIETQEKKMEAMGEENIDEDTLVLWAMGNEWFATFLFGLAHYDRAKEHFKKAYGVCIKVKGEKDPHVAILLNDLGSVCCMQKNYDEAINYFNEAVRLGEIHQSEDLASFYINLGTVHMQKKSFEEAQFNCKKALKIAKEDDNEEVLNKSLKCLRTLKNMNK